MKKLIINKKRNAGIGIKTVLMILLAVVVFLVLLFIPRYISEVSQKIKETGACGAIMVAETECRKECTGEWNPASEHLIESNNCHEGYVCCIKAWD